MSVLPRFDSSDKFLVTHGSYFGTNLFIFLIDNWFLGGEKYILNALELCFLISEAFFYPLKTFLWFLPPT